MSIKTLNVDIHTELFDEITKVVLKDCIETHTQEIAKFREYSEFKGYLPAHKHEDIDYSLKLIEALQIVLNYFGEDV